MVWYWHIVHCDFIARVRHICICRRAKLDRPIVLCNITWYKYWNITISLPYTSLCYTSLTGHISIFQDFIYFIYSAHNQGLIPSTCLQQPNQHHHPQLRYFQHMHFLIKAEMVYISLFFCHIMSPSATSVFFNILI